MRITRLYHPHPLSCGDTVSLESDSSNHLVKVLRIPSGSPVILFNGDGYDYHCTTLDRDHRHTGISVDSRSEKDTESPLDITLFQGLSKHDRMETSIQKCVELGIRRIVPVLFARSNVRLDQNKRDKKIQHWTRVAISACEQSGRSRVPQLDDVIQPEDFTDRLDDIPVRIVLDPEADRTLKDIDIQSGKLCYVIGPEGGLSQDEFELLEQLQFQRIRFGSRILRTETAGPAVLSAMQVLWGDCGR
jgi:16S rRNA (uracil1498-N3)-methyltransferase